MVFSFLGLRTIVIEPRPSGAARCLTLGTLPPRASFPLMSQPLPILMETSIQIAWDYLGRTGEHAERADYLERDVGSKVDCMICFNRTWYAA